jgi:hypothetical protein
MGKTASAGGLQVMGHRDYTDAKFLWIALLLVGLWFTYWGAWNIFVGATADIEGRIVSARMNCPQPENSRCETQYVIESLRNGNKTKYIAHAGGLTISHLLKAGSTVSKRRWKLQYEVNGNLVDDFPLSESLISIFLGLLGVVGALVLQMRIGKVTS